LNASTFSRATSVELMLVLLSWTPAPPAGRT
jgi:hypothetical protein